MTPSKAPLVDKLRMQARKIAARQPQADFYRDFARERTASAHFYRTDPLVCRLRKFVAEEIENDYGHGMDHARKVALDAGALVAIEGSSARYSKNFICQRMRMAHCAGLLHDIKRKQKDHARQGALYAGEVLSYYPFSAAQVKDICTAIANHEAFRECREMPTESCRLMSDCLYDSDKFRFGPDNFTHTVWDMVELSNISIEKFVEYYPKAIEFLEKIKKTFRTPTGQKYGPQFIDIGIAIGEDLLAYIKAVLNKP